MPVAYVRTLCDRKRTHPMQTWPNRPLALLWTAVAGAAHVGVYLENSFTLNSDYWRQPDLEMRNDVPGPNS